MMVPVTSTCAYVCPAGTSSGRFSEVKVRVAVLMFISVSVIPVLPTSLHPTLAT